MIDLDLLRDSDYHEQFLPGEPIPKTAVKKMYITVSGTVGVYGGDGKKTQNLCAGRAFGEQYLFTGYSEQIFRAEGAVTLFAIAEDSFGKIARTNPSLLFALLRDAYQLPQETNKEEITQRQEAQGAAEPPSAAMQLREFMRKREEAKNAVSITAEQAPALETVTQGGKKTANPLYPAGHPGYPGIVKPEYKKFLFEKEYQCPNCGQSFQGWKVFLSKLVPVSPTRYDLRKNFRDFETAWYDILTCPHCCFSALTDYFVEPVNFSKTKIQAALAEAKEQATLDFDAERDLDYVFAVHYIALACASAFAAKQKQIELRLWSNLSWLYEDMEDREMENYAVFKAADAGEALYMSGNLNKVQEQVVCLEIAGMLYRGGEREKLSRWLFNAKTAKTGKKIYSNLAEDLWETIRDEKR